jgi:UDP-4-amino-4-deoxy-L-arabinose-oxoglutarate aminotransferase
MTPSAVEGALSGRTKVVIPVHLYGQMCDVKAIRATLDASGHSDVRILEDAAHCFEGSRDGATPGTWSDLAVFSFYATKNVTCGEGGAIVCRDAQIAATLRQTRLHGMSAGAADRFKAGQYRHWDMTRLGVKANLPDLLAALLGPQIASIRGRLPVRQGLAGRYRQAFAGTGIGMQRRDAGVESGEHIFPIHVPGEHRDQAIALLNEAGISVAVNYRNVPTLTYYREKYGYRPATFPVAENWGSGTLTLPLFPSISRAEQDHVIQQVLQKLVPLCEGHFPGKGEV